MGIIRPEQIVVSLLPQFFWQFSRFILRQERHVLHFREENQVGPCSLADKIITLLEIRFHIFGHSHLCHGKLHHSFPPRLFQDPGKGLGRTDVVVLEMISFVPFQCTC